MKSNIEASMKLHYWILNLSIGYSQAFREAVQEKAKNKLTNRGGARFCAATSLISKQLAPSDKEKSLVFKTGE